MKFQVLSSSLMAMVLVGCVAAPPAPVATPSPSIGASSAPAEAPSPSSVPSQAPPRSPLPVESSIRWSAGQWLKTYDFKGVGGVYFNALLNQLFVLDATEAGAVSPRFLVRKFTSDGTYLSSVDLAPTGSSAPDAVDALTFDATGAPVYAYRNDGAFQLLKLLTSTVVAADRYPLNAASWAGPVALYAKGAVLHAAVLGLDVEKRDAARGTGQTPSMTGGSIDVGIAEEDEPAQALFKLPDPFYPTRAMGFSAAGELYVAGQTQSGGFGVKRLTADRAFVDISDLSARPDGIWPRPDGGVFLTWDVTGQASRVRHLESDGRASAEAELRLADGGFVTHVRGLTVDRGGRILLSGAGFDGRGQRVSGLFTFTR